MLRRTVVVTVIPRPAQLFLVHNTVTSCAARIDWRAAGPGRGGSSLGHGVCLTRASPADTAGLSGAVSCRYLKHTLDQYVESDYTLLYLHHGLTSDNKPSFSWLRDAYREFDRKWVGALGDAPGPRGASTATLCWAALCLGRSVYTFHAPGEAGAPLPG